MDTKTLFEWLKTLPVWLRSVVLILLAALAFIASLSMSACGTMTSATIRNIQPNTNTNITISNSTNQTTDVDVNTKLDSIKVF